MGIPLVKLLAPYNNVWVTSRSVRPSSGNLHYVHGNAQSKDFIFSLLQTRHYDAIVDFMARSYENLQSILSEILVSTDQYVFISSARVYAELNAPITEDTPRLLDCSTDKDFLKTEEYSLTKAREENLLFASEEKNFTIIRPSITYNDYRLQLGMFEKEAWLYRALRGRSIVFSEDLADKITTMTHGHDVARGIAALIGRTDALGQVYHITSPLSLPWRTVLSAYVEVLEEQLQRPVNVCWTKKTAYRKFKEQEYRLKYCRLYNRRFDNSRIGKYLDVFEFTSPEQGLKDCLRSFLQDPLFSAIDWRIEGLHDKAAKEKTPLAEIPDLPGKVTYLAYRYGFSFILPVLKKARGLKYLSRL